MWRGRWRSEDDVDDRRWWVLWLSDFVVHLEIQLAVVMDSEWRLGIGDNGDMSVAYARAGAVDIAIGSMQQLSQLPDGVSLVSESL